MFNFDLSLLTNFVQSAKIRTMIRLVYLGVCIMEKDKIPQRTKMKVHPSGEKYAKESPQEKEMSSQEALNKFYKTVGKIAVFLGATALYSRGMDTQMFVPAAIGGAGMLAMGTQALYNNSALVRSFCKAIDAEMTMNEFTKNRHLSESKEEFNKSHIAKFSKKIQSFRSAIRPEPTFEVTRSNPKTGKNETTTVSKDKRNMAERIFHYMKTRGK